MHTYFSIVFRDARTKLGCSEADFARLLAIDESEVQLIESCQLFPEFDTLLKLKELVDLDVGIIDLIL